MWVFILPMFILLGVLFIAAIWMMAVYNGLVTLRLAVKNGWAQIDVQLKRRHDLIPNIVNTVQGYASHERETLDRVVQARAKATTATLPADRIQAEGELSAALTRLLAVSEAYPELKAQAGFLQLQQELAETEDRVALTRQGYNDNVTRYNTRLQTFPTVVVASILGFSQEPLFEVDSSERTVPKVQF